MVSENEISMGFSWKKEHQEINNNEINNEKLIILYKIFFILKKTMRNKFLPGSYKE